MNSSAAKSPYAGHRFPAEVISQAVWLYFRFPLSLRMVEEMLAARGIIASHETVRQWALNFGQAFANEVRRRLPRDGRVPEGLGESPRHDREPKRRVARLLKPCGGGPRVWAAACRGGSAAG